MLITLPSQVVHTPILLSANAEVTGGPITAQCTPALVCGVTDVPAACYPVSQITGKTAYRTLNRYRITCPSDIWNVATTVLTIEATVEQTTMPPQVGLFGFIHHQRPSPVYCAVINGKFYVVYQTADGVKTTVSAPWPTTSVVNIKVVLDLVNGLCTIILNSGLTTTAVPIGVLSQPDTPYFGIGAIADSAYILGDYVGGPCDWTFHSLKFTGGISSGPNTNESLIPFCRLLCDQPGPVHCYTGQHTYGFMLDSQQGNTTNVYIHDLTINSSLKQGPLIQVGAIYDPTLEKVTLNGGGQGVWIYQGSGDYVVRLYDCKSNGSQIGLVGQGIIWARGLEFGYPGISAVRMQGGLLSMKDTFVGGGSHTGAMVDLRDGSCAVIDDLNADYEGNGPQYYFRAENAHPNVIVPFLELHDCFLGKVATVADIALTKGVGANPLGQYTISRVFGDGMRQITTQVDPSWTAA